MPELNLLALWKVSDTWKESNGLGKQTKNYHWEHSPNHGLALLLVNSQGELMLTWEQV